MTTLKRHRQHCSSFALGRSSYFSMKLMYIHPSMAFLLTRHLIRQQLKCYIHRNTPIWTPIHEANLGPRLSLRQKLEGVAVECQRRGNSSHPATHRVMSTCLSRRSLRISWPPGMRIGDNIHVLCLGPQLLSSQPRCEFHTSPRRPIHPILLMLIRPLGQVTAIVTGRFLRKWWRALPEEKKTEFKEHLYQSRWKLGLVFLSLVAAGIFNYYYHIQEAPITRRKRFIAFTPEQFRKIVSFEFDLHWAEVKDHVVHPDHPAYGKIMAVVNRIMQSNQDLEFFRQQTWTVIVVDSPEENAFVLPTGHIFVFTGLLKAVQNDDQLAVVLGHEMAHALLGHGAEQVSFAHIMDVFVIFVMAAIWLTIPSDGIALITQWFYKKVVNILLHLPYNRKLEREADEVGLQLIAKACFDVRESSNFWNMMAIMNETNGNEEPPPEFLSTHPNHEKRAQHLDDLLDQVTELREKCGCKRLPPADPRLQLDMLRQMMKEAHGAKTEKKMPSVESPAEVNVLSVPVAATQGS